jgi:hypothetical protein
MDDALQMDRLLLAWGAVMRYFSVCVLTVLLGVCVGCGKEGSEPSGDAASDVDTRSIVKRAQREVTSGDLLRPEKLMNTAVEAARKEDLDARLVSADYKAGNRDLRFRSASFTFNSPKLKKAGERKTSIRVRVRGTEVRRIRLMPYYWVENVDYDLGPARAFKAALTSEFDDWWKKHPKAGLYMELKRDSEYFTYRPKNSEWLWEVMGSGPGVGEDFFVYVEEGSFEVLGTKRKKVSVP